MTFLIDELREKNVQEHMLLHNFPRFLTEIGVERLFSDFHWSVASDRYAGIDLLFGKMANPTLDKFNLFPSMLDSIAAGGLEGVIRRGYSRGYNKLVSMKVSQLLAYLTTITTWNSLCAYTREFYERARFREVDFDLFMEGFRERFGRDIKPFVDDWYTTREVPRLVIKGLTYRQTGEVQVVDFKVGNTGEVDGVVSVIEAFSDDYGKWIIAVGGASRSSRENTSGSWPTRLMDTLFSCPPIFRDASPNVLDSMAPRYGRERFPLSVSFRLTRTSFILPVKLSSITRTRVFI